MKIPFAKREFFELPCINAKAGFAQGDGAVYACMSRAFQEHVDMQTTQGLAFFIFGSGVQGYSHQRAAFRASPS